MDYGAILSRAWKITWNHKILWVFGFLAGLASGDGGGGNTGGGGGGQPGGPGGPGGPGFLPPDFERQMERPEVIGIILAVACVLILIAIALFVLSTIGRGGLIGGIRMADDTDKVTFGEAWAVGVRYFWRLFGIELLLALAESGSTKLGNSGGLGLGVAVLLAHRHRAWQHSGDVADVGVDSGIPAVHRQCPGGLTARAQRVPTGVVSTRF